MRKREKGAEWTSHRVHESITRVNELRGRWDMPLTVLFDDRIIKIKNKIMRKGSERQRESARAGPFKRGAQCAWCKECTQDCIGTIY